MIVVRLTGGLGNQMFQYAAGAALAARHGVELYLDLSWFPTQTLRQYELGVFSLPAKQAPDRILEKIVSPRFSMILGLAKRLGLSLPFIPLFKEPHFHYFQGMKSVTPPALIVGSWQSEKYFQEIANEVRSFFSFSNLADEPNKRMLDIINQADAAVSIHIRRGDYVSNSYTNQEHGTCSPTYYEKCIQSIASRVESPHFFVFSDDPDWVRGNFNTSPHPMTPVDINDETSGHLDMMLMSACDHHVIANSSFSWWGAWLNPSSDKIVYAPARWFRNSSHNTNDIIPESWTKIEG